MSDVKPEPAYLGHRRRLRERFARGGLTGMHDYEKIELLLTFSIPRCDVKPAARRLLERFDGLPGVLDADAEALCQVAGVGENSAVLLRLVRALANDYLESRMRQREVLRSTDAVVDFARMKLGGHANETFMTIYLDSQLQVLDFDFTEGTVDRAVVFPRNVMRRCLERNASALIVLHNHPSGVCTASPEDVALTVKLESICQLHGVQLKDHIVVSRTDFASVMPPSPAPTPTAPRGRDRWRGVADIPEEYVRR